MRGRSHRIKSAHVPLARPQCTSKPLKDMERFAQVKLKLQSDAAGENLSFKGLKGEGSEELLYAFTLKMPLLQHRCSTVKFKGR